MTPESKTKIKNRLDLSLKEQQQVMMDQLFYYLMRYSPMERYYAKMNLENFLTGYVNYEKQSLSEDFISQLESLLTQTSQSDLSIHADLIYFLSRFMLQKERYNTVSLLCSSFIQSCQNQLSQVDPLTLSYIKHFAEHGKNDNATQTDQTKLKAAQKYTNLSVVKARLNLTENFIEEPFECLFHDYKEPVRTIMAKIYFNKMNEDKHSS